MSAKQRLARRSQSSVVFVATALALAACAGGTDKEAATTTTSTEQSASTEEETTTMETGPSPDVVAWVRTWRRKVDKPMRKEARIFLANAESAAHGSSSADFRVSSTYDKLSNCRLPLDTRLSNTPSELTAARRSSLEACRLAYVGVNTYIKGWNKFSEQGYASEESEALVGAGISRVKKALKNLRKAERIVARATA